MARQISTIWPLLIITLVCIALVEGGYQLLERFVFDARKQSVEVAESQATVSKERLTNIVETSGDYRIILTRNLFGSATRDDAATKGAETDTKAPLEATKLNIVLMGTAIGDEEASRAFILDRQNNKQEVYELGDTVQGATIKEVMRGKVILSVNGKDEILDMSEAASVRPTLRPITPPRLPAGAAVNRGNTINTARPDRRIRRVRRTVFGAGGNTISRPPRPVSPRIVPGQRPQPNQ
jgi:type II secretory pathway component PulC